MPQEESHRNDPGLYPRLMDAYSDRNLNRITGWLIELYKTRNYPSIRNLAHQISRYVPVDTERDARCFSTMIRLYHPDRGPSIRDTLTGYFNSGRTEKLFTFSHIFLLDDLEEISAAGSSEDTGFEPSYEWEDTQDGYDYFHENDQREGEMESADDDKGNEHTFYDAVRIRMYGNTETEFPAHYLEDFEEIEFADCQIELLDGIEHCKHVISLDLSGNKITDISNLWHLDRLEELYLADNQVGYIDSLCNLTNLRVIDISGNEIDDLTPLLGLENLEYVNLIGNKIPENQVNQLKAKGIIVMN